MRLPTLLLAACLLTACSATTRWAANVGVDDDRIGTRTYDAGRRLAVDIHRPASATAAAPVVVYFPGGRWRTGDRDGARFVGERLAEAGALVLVPDVRQAPDVRFPAFVEDAARAVAWARAHAREFGGDPARVFVMGHSSGAHVAAMLGTDARYLQAVGMTPRDLAGVVGWSGPYDFLPIRDIDLIDVFGTGIDWPASQPVNFVDGDEPPFLLVHGLDDDVVLPRNSERLQATLRDAGIPVRYVPLEDTGHAGVLVGLKLPGDGPALVATRRFLGLGAATD
jgi:acetyl esterase/lipase